MSTLKTVRAAKISYIVMSVLFCVLGVVLLVTHEMSVSVLGVLVGAMLIAFGIVKLIGYFSRDLYRLAFQFDLAIGLFLAIIGVLTLIVGSKDPLGTVRLFGIYIFIDGLLKLQTAFDAKKFGIARWLVILLTAILMVGVGIVGLLASYLEQISQLIVLDVALMLDGLVNIWITAYTVRIRAKKKNLEERFGLKE